MNKDQFFSILGQYKSLWLVGPMLQTSIYEQFDSIIKNLPCIAVDSGFDKIQNLNPVALLSVGDQDSSRLPMDIKLERDKDFTDLEFALSLIPDIINKLYLLGFLNGRKDHELAVLGAVNSLLKKRTQTQVFMDNQIIFLSKGNYTFNIEGCFSILALSSETKLKLTGECQYTLSSLTNLNTLSGLGISNIGHGDIHLQVEDAPIMLFFIQEEA